MRIISLGSRLLSQPLSAAIYLLLLTFLWTGTIVANTNTTSLTGRVLTQNGLPVSGANIILRQENGHEQNITADEVGNFHLDNIISGNYQLIVQASGFTTLAQPVSLQSGEKNSLILMLPVAGTQPVSSGSAEEIQLLKRQLAETNEQLAKLSAIVQELQAKATTPARTITAIAAPEAASATAITNSVATQSAPQSDKSDPNDSTIDSLIKPKLAGGNFAGAQGLVKTDRIKIGGYADFRYVTRSIDEAFETRGNIEEENEGNILNTNFKRNSFISPRLIVAIAAALTDRLLFNSEIEFEFAGKETEIEQAYLEYRFNPKFNFRGGVFVPPIGRFNTFHDANLQDIASRPLVSTLVIPSTYKDAGVGLLGEFKLGKHARLSYEGYVVNGLRSDEGGELARKTGIFESKGNNRFFDNNSQKSVVGRIVFSPILGVEAGLSGYRGKHDNQGQYDLSIWAFDGKFNRGNFQVLGEYARTSLQRTPEDDAEIAAKNFLLALPNGDYTNTFDFFDENLNEALFDKPARSLDGFYIEARYRFHPRFLTEHSADDASIAPVFRYDQVNLDRSFPNFRFPLNMRRYSMGLSIRPTEAASFNFTYHIDRKPDIFLRLPDGKPFPPLFTNLGIKGFSFGMSYAF